MNKTLFFFDFILFLPITLIRLLIIYFHGSRYNLEGFKFLDVMTHAENLYFNQQKELTIDTLNHDVKIVINDDEFLISKKLEITKDESCQNNKTVCGLVENTLKSEKKVRLKNEENQINTNHLTSIFKQYNPHAQNIVDTELIEKIADDALNKLDVNFTETVVENIMKKNNPNIFINLNDNSDNSSNSNNSNHLNTLNSLNNVNNIKIESEISFENIDKPKNKKNNIKINSFIETSSDVSEISTEEEKQL